MFSIYIPSSTAFRSISGSSAYTPKGKSQLIWPKSEEKQHANGFTYQGPSDRQSGGWSHDWLPKMVLKKTKVVALHCSFQNQLELCSKVLPLWRYNIKDFQKHLVFFCFLHFSWWKQHQITWFHHICKAKRRGYNCCTVENLKTTLDCRFKKPTSHVTFEHGI